MVDFKMTKEGLILYVKDYSDIIEVLQKIDEKIKSMGTFFKNGDKIMLLVEEHEKHISDVPKIVTKINELGLEVSHILMGNEDNKDVVIKRKVDMVNQGDTKSGTKVVRRNIRSGQNVVHSGDVILIGNLHPGAEIIAGGSVVIFGRCQGIVRAGINEGRSAVITALTLETPFVQLGDLKGSFSEKVKEPVVLYEKAGRVVFEKVDLEKLGGI